jgi:hypothetical protein
MKKVLTTLFAGSILIALSCHEAMATAKAKPHSFQLYANRAAARDLLAEDVGQPPPRLRSDSPIVVQIRQAKSNMHGTFAVHYVVPGRVGTPL